MNLSSWDEYTIEKQQELLGRLGAAIKSRQMPPARSRSPSFYNLSKEEVTARL
jgi:hypothetical protein